MEPDSPKTLIIEADQAEKQYWKDLWRFRELFYFLAWRDILVRYKQTYFGFAWAVIRPLLTMIVLTFVFGRLARLPSNGVPYAILVFAAMLPWQFFSSATQECSSSLIRNPNLISKVFFPRFIIPSSTVTVALVDLCISLMIMAGLMVWYGFMPSFPHIFMLPIFILIAYMAAMGFGLWFASLNVRYRDFRYIVAFFVQFGLYISPVGFSSDLVPEKWRLLYSLNPMVGVIDGFRWSIIGGDSLFYWPGFSLSLGLLVLVLLSGIHYFRKTERTFADII